MPAAAAGSCAASCASRPRARPRRAACSTSRGSRCRPCGRHRRRSRPGPGATPTSTARRPRRAPSRSTGCAASPPSTASRTTSTRSRRSRATRCASTSPTLHDDPVGAWLFEPTEGLLDESVWPLWEGERLTLVAQLDLTDPALRDVDLPLPVAGRLLFLWAAVQAPSGQLAEHAGAGRVLHVPTPGGAAPATRLSVELDAAPRLGGAGPGARPRPGRARRLPQAAPQDRHDAGRGAR